MPVGGAGDVLGKDVERARNLIDIHRYGDAEAVLRRVLAADPDHFGGLSQLAWLLDLDNRPNEAAEVAALLVARYPNHREGHRRFGWIRFHQRRRAEAESHARRAVELAPDAADMWTLLGRILALFPGRTDEALAAADEAIRLDPHGGAGYQVRARIYSANKRWSDAEAALAEALARAPHSTDNLADMALVKLRLGKIEEARGLLTSCLRLDPSPRAVRDVIRDIETNGFCEQLADVHALACFAVGRPRLNVPGAAGNDGELLTEQARLAQTLWREAKRWGHTWPRAAGEQARALVTAILAADPTHRVGREAAMAIADEDGDHVGADALATGLLADGYDDVPHTYLVAIDAAVKLARAADALDLAQTAAARHPDHLELSCWHWRMLLTAGHRTEAVAAAGHATGLAAASPRRPLIELARAATESGSSHDAVQLLDAVLTPTTGAHLGRLHRAALLVRAHNFVDAETLLASGPPSADGLTHVMLASARLTQGKWTRALADLERAFAAPARESTVPRLIRDQVRNWGVPYALREVYLEALTLLGEADSSDAMVPSDRANLWYGLVGLLMIAATEDNPEALRWARAVAADARALDPKHASGSVIEAILADPESADARTFVETVRTRLAAAVT
ncbi:tetratricopeptide repeat protein [Embleya sp. NPDC056575]|uniref:tetratricopeptide repeat protein n=1 Tax=unclassified Embleya TaxID=2699296 RepID=UPI0036C4D8E3